MCHFWHTFFIHIVPAKRRTNFESVDVIKFEVLSSILVYLIQYRASEIIFFSEVIVKNDKWRPLSLSKLTLIVFNMELTHLGSETSKCTIWVLWLLIIYSVISNYWNFSLFCYCLALISARDYMEASKPKWVNSILISLMLIHLGSETSIYFRILNYKS